MEKTLVVIKPDAVRRRLVGAICSRFETAGLDLVQIDRRTVEPSLIERHYPSDESWLASVGEKTLADYENLGIDAVSQLGTNDAVEIGRKVKRWLVEFMTSDDVVSIVLEGNRSVSSVRKLVGGTLPVAADPGTIRGDYSTDSPDLANLERRPVRNLIHASGTVEEARTEIELWFPSQA